jgi:PAS domain S-box-containing protein
MNDAPPDKEQPSLQSQSSDTLTEMFAEAPWTCAIECAFDICNHDMAVMLLVNEQSPPIFYYHNATKALSASDEKRVINFCEGLVSPGSQPVCFSGMENHKEQASDGVLVTDYVLMPLKTDDGSSLTCLYLLNASIKALSKQQSSMLNLLVQNLSAQLTIVQKNYQLQEAKEIYNLITEGNPDLIFAKDADYKLVFANQAFMALYPEDMQDKVIGYTTVEEYNQAEATAFLEKDKLALDTGFSETLEKIAFPDGRTKMLHTTKKRFFDHKKQAYLLGVSRDVTERETLIQQLEKSNAELDQFAYVASHDLKAPLSAIKRLSQWIFNDCNDLLPDKSKEHLNLLMGRSERMRRLLEDLLAYSRIGRDVYKPEKFELSPLIDGLVELVDKPNTFTVNVSSARVYLPRMPLERIFINLISNAIKHHDKASGIIDITCKKTQKYYRIAVSDDGPGIRDEFHENVFLMFQTLQPRDEVEGSGMGLSMVKKIVEHYNGTVTVKNNQPRGCTFTLTWPLLAHKDE